METTTDKKPYGTVLIRAKEILDYLEQQDHPANLQEIYTALNTSKSTVLKILNTLCSIDYVKRDEETKKYTLGTALIRYGEAARKSFDIVNIAEPELIELNEALGETIHMGIYERDQIIYVKKLNGKGKIILRSQVGHSLDLYCSAMGKAYLAELSKEEVLAYLQRTPLVKMAKNTITDPEQLLKNLQTVKECGYAVDDRENEDEIYCVGTVLKYNGRVEGMISVSSPIFRINEEKKQKTIALILEARQKIESKMN
ncbi:IclR family transcriptional regulator [Heyndrickxia acidiproducens]|uniref:IclR family transcriptional regulator n=1 Tax=Heyndrickxia acidiproducens TaxID=1121084 RepID=UPI000366CA5B|nr:IclR family transcriptional regulator [Heyndrickxia acidiproducens]